MAKLAGLCLAAWKARTRAEVKSLCPLEFLPASKLTFPLSLTILCTFWKSSSTAVFHFLHTLSLWSRNAALTASYPGVLFWAVHVYPFILEETFF